MAKFLGRLTIAVVGAVVLLVVWEKWLRSPAYDIWNKITLDDEYGEYSVDVLVQTAENDRYVPEIKVASMLLTNESTAEVVNAAMEMGVDDFPHLVSLPLRRCETNFGDRICQTTISDVSTAFTHNCTELDLENGCYSVPAYFIEYVAGKESQRIPVYLYMKTGELTDIEWDLRLMSEENIPKEGTRGTFELRVPAFP